jgi:hypothetical protein
MLQPQGFDEQNMTIGFGQMMYTPNDKTRSDLIKDDRPFAGALMLSLGYNARRRYAAHFATPRGGGGALLPGQASPELVA